MSKKLTKLQQENIMNYLKENNASKWKHFSTLSLLALP